MIIPHKYYEKHDEVGVYHLNYNVKCTCNDS